MKKILAVVAILATFAMLFTGCTGNKADDNVLVMATNATFPPYEFYEGDKIVGIDAEIAEAIAEKLGMELRIDDMGLAGMTITEDRLESVDFSTSYATGIQAIIVPADSKIATADDLFAEGASHNIGVQTNTTGDIYASDDLEAKGLAKIERFNKGADAVTALVAGKLDCVIIDNEPAKAFVEANKDAGLKILETAYAVEDYAICFAKDNDELTTKVDNALKELIADGTVQKIIDKYISAE